MMIDRFERQYKLPGFGRVAQQKLVAARVLVVGAGGLGCPALLYLAAAGVGTIAVADGDVVAVSNLNRQVLFGRHHVGRNKADVAAELLQGKYEGLNVVAIPNFLNTDNILDIISGFDVVVDGSDNFPTRYLVNDACVIAGIPLVFGAIYQNEGQVAILNAEGLQSANYRDLFPIAPMAKEVPNCSETGVLGVLPGVIGTMMAAECIKFLTGYGDNLSGKLLLYSLVDHSTYQVKLEKNPESEKTSPKNAFELTETDYADFCGMSAEIEWADGKRLVSEGAAVLIDIRQPHEQPRLDGQGHLEIDFESLLQEKRQFAEYKHILLFCQSGIRSLKAAKDLQTIFPDKDIRSIRGGILQMA